MHDIYLIHVLGSFIYSAHVLPKENLIGYIVLGVDALFIIVILLPILIIRWTTYRSHHIIVSLKNSMKVIAIIMIILYSLFITVVSFTSSILRFLADSEYIGFLFCFECAHFVLYLALLIVTYSCNKCC